MYRKAVPSDAAAIAAIYGRIHDGEEAGRSSIGWIRSIYPSLATAEKAIAEGEMYVSEHEGILYAAARINQKQEEVYYAVPWRYPASDREVLVLHTLVVDPRYAGRGEGSGFVAFYESMARDMGCTALRMDTNERNEKARRLYKRLGYREAGIMPCVFNGIPGVGLVCLEKKP